MKIAKFALITLVSFAVLTGCGMVSQQVEMPEDTTTTTVEKSIDEISVPTPEKSTYQEVTLKVEGMT